MALPDGRDSAALEREASVGTPLEWNCTEAGSFDTNVRGSPHEAVEASKQAVAIRRCLTFLFMSRLSRLCRTQQSAAPESLGASKEPEEVQGPSALGSWLPDGSASLSKFSSTAEMLASQAAGLFSKSEEPKAAPEPANLEDAGMPDAPDAPPDPSLPKDPSVSSCASCNDAFRFCRLPDLACQLCVRTALRPRSAASAGFRTAPAPPWRSSLTLRRRSPRKRPASFPRATRAKMLCLAPSRMWRRPLQRRTSHQCNLR